MQRHTGKLFYQLMVELASIMPGLATPPGDPPLFPRSDPYPAILPKVLTIILKSVRKDRSVILPAKRYPDPEGSLLIPGNT